MTIRSLIVAACLGLLSLPSVAVALTPSSEIVSPEGAPTVAPNWRYFTVDQGDTHWRYGFNFLTAEGLTERFSVLDFMGTVISRPENKDVVFGQDNRGWPTFVVGQRIFLPVSDKVETVVVDGSRNDPSADVRISEVEARVAESSRLQATLASELKSLATEVALLNDRELTVDNIVGLNERLEEIRASIPELSALTASAEKIERFMDAFENGEEDLTKFLRDRIVADVVASIDPKLNALSVRMDAAERGVAELTADGGVISLMRADIDRLTAEGGPLATMRADIDALTADGGRLAIVEERLVALTAEGGTIPLIQTKLDELATGVADNRAAHDALFAEGGEITLIKQRLDAVEGRVDAVEDVQSRLWIWGLVGMLVAVGLALIGSHFWSERRSAPTRVRVKRLEDIELTDLEWHPANPEVTTIESGLEKAITWRVRQKGTTDWCIVKLGREADTSHSEVFTDIPSSEGGDASAVPIMISDVKLEVLKAIKQKRLVPVPVAAAA